MFEASCVKERLRSKPRLIPYELRHHIEETTSQCLKFDNHLVRKCYNKQIVLYNLLHPIRPN